MSNNAVTSPITNAAYGQLIAQRKQGFSARESVEATIDSLIEEYLVSRRKAALIVTQAWADLEDTGKPAAFVDVSRTTANMVVVKDTATGCTSIFSVHELLQFRANNPDHVNRIHA
ncbi:hypothetical protein ABWH88_02145 [Marinobacter adhaerens]|uniref:hypothetical protein n=1 Tax=Marinobacter adhaerens TaxID=1033846 RepID=UPI0035D08031